MGTTVMRKLLLCSVFVSAVVLASMAYSHCQIPCGIYNDQMRFDMIAEHIATIEKSMKLITELSNQDKPNMNQIVRWVQNKDQHADEMSRIITYYFMAQRLKWPGEDDVKAHSEYVKKLTLLHKMLVHTMRAKQATDFVDVAKLKSLLAEFQDLYLGKNSHSSQDNTGHRH